MTEEEGREVEAAAAGAETAGRACGIVEEEDDVDGYWCCGG